MSLVANHLESTGIATVVVGSARDIVEECGVPRFVFVDHPLGNPVGRPWQPDEQRAILELALGLVDSAPAPRTTVAAPTAWPDDGWRDRFMAIDDLEALAAKGERRRAARARISETPS